MRLSSRKIGRALAALVVLGVFLVYDRIAGEGGPLASVSSAGDTDNASKRGDSFSGKVQRVVDGDSLYVSSRDKQIRLWAVDAPERDENGYKKAGALLKKITLHKKIRCEVKDTDKYGRIVARCELESGGDINKQMIESGLTNEYCRFSKNFYGTC